MTNILLIGQIPPPYHGQSIMIEKICNHSFEKVKLTVIRMKFSDNLSSVGKFKLRKILQLIHLLINITMVLVFKRIDGVYYPPAGHSRIPVFRDIIILHLLKLSAKPLIFHYHALGLKDFYESSGRLLQFLIRRTYSSVDHCICLSKKNIPEVEFLKPKNIHVIPYGVEDKFEGSEKIYETDVPKILYLGNLYKSKGVTALMDSAAELKNRGIKFKLIFVGGFKDANYQKEIELHSMYNEVHFEGILTGERKFNEFANADIFCLPTNYENENFPVVIIEALSARLPIVSLDWRAVGDMVSNKNGFLLNEQDPIELADSLEILIADFKLRERLGSESRKLFLENFHENLYLERIEEIFQKIS